MVRSKRTSLAFIAANTFGTLGYISLIFQWAWTGLILASPVFPIFSMRIPGKIFERNHEGISLGTILGSKNINTEVNAKMPLLSFLAINYSIPVIAEVIRWFEECIIRNYANPLAEQQILLSDDDVSKKQFLTMMNDMGIGITGYQIGRAHV